MAAADAVKGSARTSSRGQLALGQQGKRGTEWSTHLVPSCASVGVAHTPFLLIVICLLACLLAIRGSQSPDNLEEHISVAKRWITWFAYFL